MDKEIMELIKQEIDWCLENPSTDVSQDFQKGFIAGLKQTIYLIREAKNDKGSKRQ